MTVTCTNLSMLGVGAGHVCDGGHVAPHLPHHAALVQVVLQLYMEQQDLCRKLSARIHLFLDRI